MLHPVVTMTSRSRAWTAASFATRTPPTTSAWPLMNLVMECSTTSAPRSSGLWRYGLANVLSTASRLPCSWAMAAAAGMSVTCIAGLDGDST